MTAASARVRLAMILIVAAALPCRAEDVISGRGEGTAQIPADQQIRTGGIYSSPIVGNGAVYFGSADGFVYALE